MKPFKLAAVLVMMAVLLSACRETEEEPWVPDSTAIQVAGDGRITETLIDRLEKDYYSSTELKEMLEDAAASYSAEYGADRVTVDAFEAEGSNVRIVLQYAGAEDYAAFNNVRFYNGSMLGAQMAGFRFETTFQIVAKDGTVSSNRVSADGPVSHKEYLVLVTDRSHKVEVPGSIVYVSAPAAVENRRIVSPQVPEAPVDRDEAGQSEADLLYILYEL